MDFDKATAELPVLRDFIDFVNKQAGVFMDCLGGFEGNAVRITRQIPRVNRPTGREIRNGEPTIIWTTFDDPGAPDIIINTVSRSQDYLSANAETGFNEQQVCWSIIVFIFTYWDEEIRPAIAEVRGVKSGDVMVDALGDLRILRKAIIHNKGIVSAKEHAKLKLMSALAKPDKKLKLAPKDMHQIFVFIKQAIGQLITHYVSNLPGTPDITNLKDIAIQNAGPRK